MPKDTVPMKAILILALLAALPILAQNASVDRSRGGAISGRVLDVHGSPLPNVCISAFPGQYYYIPVDYPEGRHSLSHTSPVGAGTLGAGAKTNERGEYRFDYRPAGEYFLCLQKGSDDKAFCGIENFGAQYFPGTSDISKAVALHVRAGVDLTGVDWVLPIERPQGITMSGSIVNVEGQPLAPYHPIFVLVPHTPFEEPVNGRGVFDMAASARFFPAIGHYEIRNVPPGSYDLVVRGQGETWGARMPIDVGTRDIPDLNIVLRPDPDVKLEGRVIVNEPNGDTSPFPFQSLEMRVFGDVYFWKGGQTVRTDASGKIGFDYVPADGNYALRIRELPPNAYVADIRQGGESIYDNARFGAYPIKMTSNPAPIEVVIGTSGGTIDGVAEDALQKGAAGVTVTLAPVASRRQNPYLFKTVEAGAQGHFTFTGVGPGDYKVFAWEAIPPAAYLNPGYLAPHERESVPVSIGTASSANNLRVRVIPSP
jgi:hypothetical protein